MFNGMYKHLLDKKLEEVVQKYNEGCPKETLQNWISVIFHNANWTYTEWKEWDTPAILKATIVQIMG